MKTLPPIRPTREQLALISENRYGVEVIRGAAGSGKTSTAILRLRSLLYMVQERFEREGIERPIKILVLTFNRTLSGYVRVLAQEQVAGRPGTDMMIETFARWAMIHLGWPNVVQDGARQRKLEQFARGLPLSSRYVGEEVDYLLGRFEPEDLELYITEERTGRGAEPRVDRILRRRLLDEVVYPYVQWLSREGLIDWNDVAVRMARTVEPLEYDIVIVDESQDFSANQLRAVRRHVADDHAVTFVIDTIQRIYARGFSWQEIGFDLRRARSHTLRENHRNTKQIARFAAGILTGMAVEADGAMPNLRAATREGDVPVVLIGRYSRQVDAALDLIRGQVDLTAETVAFLAPLGG
jgi:superfamily I DNA/RNA helicase